MMNRALGIQLLRIGRRAGRRTQTSGIRFVALLAATAFLGLGLTSAVAVAAVYGGRSTHDQARSPIDASPSNEASAKELWTQRWDTVGKRQFAVVFIYPRSADAPLPPGVSHWPGPGQAVLSPALLKSGAADGISTRYGHVVGAIGFAGLDDPEELLAYVRPPSDLLPQPMQPVVGYGINDQPAFGDSSIVKAESMFAPLLGGLILLPAAILLFIAARTGSRDRDRRLAVAEILGARRVDRALITIGEAGPAVALGAVVALIPLATALARNLRLPVVDYVLSDAYLRADLWPLLAAWLLSIAIVLITVTALDTQKSRAATRPLGSRRVPARWAALCPAMLLLAVRGPDLFAAGTTPHLLINYLGIAGTLATLPAVVGLLVAAVGSRLTRVGRALGSPGTVMAGGWSTAHPGMIARVSVGVITAIGLLIQAQVWFGFLDGQAQAAEALQTTLGNSVMVVQPTSNPSPGQWGSFTRLTPDTTALLTISLNPSAGQVAIEGSCAGLTLLHLPCSTTAAPIAAGDQDPRLQALLTWYGDGATRQTEQVGTSAVSTSAAEETVVLAVSTSGSDLSGPDLERVAYETLPGGASVGPIASSWVVGAQVNASQGRWIQLLGLVGVIVLTAACGISGLGEFLRWGSEVAPVSVLAGNRRVFLASAAWTVLLPMALSGILGVAIGSWLALPMTEQGLSHLSGTTLTDCALAVSVLAAALWAWAAWSSGRQAASWLPGAD